MGRMLINMIHAVEPLFAKRHERWVAFVFVSSANNLLSLTMQIQKRAPNTSSSPRDAHVNRALDPISCHKGFRTAEASESRETRHFPCRNEWPPCDWVLGEWHWTHNLLQMLWDRQHFAHRDEELGHLPTEPFAAALPWDQNWLQLFTILIYLA